MIIALFWMLVKLKFKKETTKRQIQIHKSKNYTKCRMRTKKMMLLSSTGQKNDSLKFYKKINLMFVVNNSEFEQFISPTYALKLRQLIKKYRTNLLGDNNSKWFIIL